MKSEHACHLCGSMDQEFIAEIQTKPAGETDFCIPPVDYKRLIFRCRRCSVFLNFQNHISPNFYEKAYNASTYGDNRLQRYRKIRALPPERSDNKQRVERVTERLDQWQVSRDSISILDVGSGLCVFLAELAEKGYQCHAIDPDPEAIAHAMEHAGIVSGHAGSLDNFHADERFDFISFNKVLEHVTDPVGLLAETKPHLSHRGLVYVELPDGEAARASGGVVDREEFWFEHHLVFDQASFEHLAARAGFRILDLQRIHEPSDKFTILGFLKAFDS